MAGTRLRLWIMLVVVAPSIGCVLQTEEGSEDPSDPLGEVALDVETAYYYVSTTGSDSNDGRSITRPFKTPGKLFSVLNGLGSAAAGKLAYIRGGTYAVNAGLLAKVNGTSTAKIRVFAYPGETVVFNHSNQPVGTGYGTIDSQRAIILRGNFWHLKGINFIYNRSRDGVIFIDGSDNIVESCSAHDSNATGVQIRGNNNGGGDRNLILNSKLYKLGKVGATGTNQPDGIAISDSGAIGNIVDGCTIYRTGDDGVDFWQSVSSTIRNTTVHHAGYWPDGQRSGGDGNGLKMGSPSGGSGTHKIYRNLVYSCPAVGITYNGSSTCAYQVTNNTVAHCGRNYSFGSSILSSVLRNNISFGGQNSDTINGRSPPSSSVQSPATHTYNTWNQPAQAGGQSGFPITNPKFTNPGAGDYTLLLGSPCIDKGAIVSGITDGFYGLRPDLGRFERQ